MEKTSEFHIWKGSFIRAFTLFGFSFFSTYVAGADFLTILKSSGVVAGLYFFAELMRYYGVKKYSTKTQYQPMIFL